MENNDEIIWDKPEAVNNDIIWDSDTSVDESSPSNDSIKAQSEIQASENKYTEEPIDFIAKEEQKAKDSKAKLLTLIDENPDMSEYYQKAYDNVDEALENKKVEIKKRELEKAKLDTQLEEAKKNRQPNISTERFKDEGDAFVSATYDSLLKVTKLVNQVAVPSLEAIGMKDFSAELKGRIDAASNVWGQDVAIKKAERLEKYGEETWGVGQAIGSAVPDIAVSTVTAPTKVATGLAELALSSARNELFEDTEVPLMEKLKSISADVGIAVVGMGILQKFLPTSQLDELKDLTSKIKDPTEKKAVEGAYKILDEADISSLDYSARENIVKMIVSGEVSGEEALSKVINNEIRQAKDILKQETSLAYKEANAIAETTDSIKPSRINSNFEQWFKTDDNGKTFKTLTQKQALNDFVKEIGSQGDMNAFDIEGLISSYKRKARDTDVGDKEFAYTKLGLFLEEQQENLLAKAGNSGAYNEARKLKKKDIDTFTSKSTSTEAKTAKKLEAALDSNDTFGVAEQLFTAKLDPNTVEGFLKATKNNPETRQAVFDSLITRNIDELNSQQGIKQMINNYSSMNTDGLKMLLGKKSARRLTANMRAAELIVTAIDKSEIDKKTMKDVLNLAGAAATSQITPYVSAKVALQSSKSLVSKMNQMSKERGKIYKAIAGSKKTKQAKNILKGLGMMQLSIKDTEQDQED